MKKRHWGGSLITALPGQIVFRNANLIMENILPSVSMHVTPNEL